MFVAVLPDERVVRELDELLESRRDGESGLRWVPPDAWHLTTAFMADVPDSAREGLEGNLKAAARGVESFEVGVSGGLAFPHADRTKVLALAVTEGAQELAALSARSRAAANRAGVAVEGGRFVGHLTLARHRGLSAVRWLEVLDSFPAWVWRVEEVCLVETVVPGRRYEVRARFPLGRSGARVLE